MWAPSPRTNPAFTCSCLLMPFSHQLPEPHVPIWKSRTPIRFPPQIRAIRLYPCNPRTKPFTPHALQIASPPPAPPPSPILTWHQTDSALRQPAIQLGVLVEDEVQRAAKLIVRV